MDRKLLTRILAGILALIMILSLIPIVANAHPLPDTHCDDHWEVEPKDSYNHADTCSYDAVRVYCQTAAKAPLA